MEVRGVRNGNLLEVRGVRNRNLLKVRGVRNGNLLKVRGVRNIAIPARSYCKSKYPVTSPLSLEYLKRKTQLNLQVYKVKYSYLHYFFR